MAHTKLQALLQPLEFRSVGSVRVEARAGRSRPPRAGASIPPRRDDAVGGTYPLLHASASARGARSSLTPRRPLVPRHNAILVSCREAFILRRGTHRHQARPAPGFTRPCPCTRLACAFAACYIALTWHSPLDPALSLLRLAEV
jgi:hypothetical protein